MATVETLVVCPLCGGECFEELNCRSDYASYICLGCGYGTDTETAAKWEEHQKECLPEFLPFVKFAAFGEDSGASYNDQMPWFPCGITRATQHSIAPLIVDGKLRWRRCEIEEVPEAEKEKFPLPDGSGFYCYREVDPCAHYDTFAEACAVSREENIVNGLLQSKDDPPKVELLGRTEKGGGTEVDQTERNH